MAEIIRMQTPDEKPLNKLHSTMSRRTFTMEDQRAFAELSGDYNPLHVDITAARRLLFGAPVVHAIHSLLWALDVWLPDVNVNVELTAVKATFTTAIRVGEEVQCTLKAQDDRQATMELSVGNATAAVLIFKWVASAGHGEALLDTNSPKRTECRVLSASEVARAFGEIPLHLNVHACTRLFPRLAQRFSHLQMAQLLATTRLVGMQCPGWHSIFSALDLSFTSEPSYCPVLRYQTMTLDGRFGLLSLTVSSLRMTGIVKSFLRPPTQAQVRFQDLRGRIQANEFACQRALVIGGSRGLGEVTAKLLAAGGARVVITYNQGANDAAQVAGEIVSGGGDAACMHYNVLDPSETIAGEFRSESPWTHLYYFATPFIASGLKGCFSPDLFRTFCEYYVAGFHRTFEQLRVFGLAGVFYPSSFFIHNAPLNMAEYVAAKIAGETLCDFLGKTQKHTLFYKPRLPRMATDQTISLILTRSRRPEPILLKHMRRFRDTSTLPSPFAHAAQAIR